MIRIKNVEYLKDYQLKLLFSNGKTKIVDFEPWILEGGELIQPLQDIKYFKKVKMDKFNYTVSWPNGAGFCPDVLYELGKEDVCKKRTHIVRKNSRKPIRHKQNRIVADSKH